MTVIESTVAELESQTMEVKENQVALQRKLELTESENSRLREVAADLQDGNRELEKNLANETQKNLILQDQVQLLESLLRQKEDRLVSATEILNGERTKTEIVCAELQVMKNWVSQLGGQNAKINENLQEKEAEVTSVKKELEKEKMKTQILEGEVQVMKNWVAELGGQNARHLEEVDENHLEITLLKKKLRKEKQSNRILQNALHHGKQMENLLEEEKRRGNEMETSLKNLKVELHNRDRQIQNFLNTERKLRCENEQLEQKLLELRKEYQKLKENWTIQEENMIREQRRLKDCQRRLEEALRDQDKYMLMTLLHGTAQRNFHLQHIALQHENEIMDISEKEKQEEDLCMRKEKQYRKYCDTQRERTNYGKQWEVLTHTLTDLMHGGERTPEATTGDSNNVELPRAETHEEKEG
ncbi:uncharacterized protein [Macrobrachium rosenbergii]|uniref:uncharacterized protein n=1 Tax=Macrobrachium rosenbergii TaxID=79674 RepID=UPI0034D79B95